MTRAESRLLICGYFSGKRSEKNQGQLPPKGCWHDWVGRALEELNGSYEIDTPFNSDGFKGIAFGQKADGLTEAAEDILAVGLALPDWTRKKFAKPSGSMRQVTPSHLLAASSSLGPAVKSPLKAPIDRFKRGNLIHKLLELLPDLPHEKRSEAAEQFLKGYQDISKEMRDDVVSVVFSVLDHPDFQLIFAKGSRAEVSLAGHVQSLPQSLYLNAQIDRLAVTETDVFIVDYKSNRPPPNRAQDVSDLYLGQMAAYRELAKVIYPGHRIQCGLLWTDGPNMMLLPDALLDDAIVKIEQQASL